MAERGTTRIIPRSAVTAAIEEGPTHIAFGVVRNISEGGVCICTDAMMPEGDAVLVQLSFPGQAQPVGLEGFVVWSRPEEALEGAYRYGLRWRQPPGPVLTRLLRDC